MNTASLTLDELPVDHWVDRGRHYFSGEATLTRRWAENTLVEFGPLAFRIKRAFLARRKEDPSAANEWLRRAHDHFSSGNPTWRLIYGPEEIDDKAKWCVKACTGFTSANQVAAFCDQHDLPMMSAKTPEGLLRRAENWQCWRRKLRRIVIQFRDQLMRLLGFVNKRCQVYCSDHIVEWQTHRDQATRELLSKITARSDAGDEMSLLELHELSIANPKNRFAELMVRCKGNEQWALDQGHMAMAITLTTSSRFHCCHYKSGELNKRFNGSTPGQANDYLVDLFARIRTYLGNRGIEFTGYRVAEAHHDGTPHWHAMLFFDPRFEKDIRSTFTLYAMLDSPNEPGAKEHRVKFQVIDPSQGSATGYMTKYIAKNIAGAANQPDLLGIEAPVAARRVIAWAKTWGIRQFQFFGDASVTVWREYRRIRNEGTVTSDSSHYEIWKAASIDSDWAAFKTLMGAGRSQRSSIVRGEHIHAETGECTAPLNRYGEDLSPLPIIGIERDGTPLRTRNKYWETIWTQPSEPGSSTGSIASTAITRLEPGSRLPTRSRPRRAASAAQALLTATVTKAGELMTGIPAGTVLGYPTAFDLPPTSPPDAPNVTWEIPDAYGAQRRAEQAATSGPWTCVNNCTEVTESTLRHETCAQLLADILIPGT